MAAQKLKSNRHCVVTYLCLSARQHFWCRAVVVAIVWCCLWLDEGKPANGLIGYDLPVVRAVAQVWPHGAQGRQRRSVLLVWQLPQRVLLQRDVTVNNNTP